MAENKIRRLGASNNGNDVTNRFHDHGLFADIFCFVFTVKVLFQVIDLAGKLATGGGKN
jgi:hypothetical protein